MQMLRRPYLATGHDGRIAVAVVVECCLASSRAVLVPGGN